MDNTLKRLIRLNIELEGVLRVADSRSNADALNIARDKFTEMSSLFASLAPLTSESVAKTDEPETIFPPDPVSAQKPEAEKKTAGGKAAEVPRGDIRKMLTLNDKFLFRREIFNGNDTELNDTLDLIASMDTLQEAEEYLYDDLQLDAENESVGEFISILESYFNNGVR